MIEKIVEAIIALLKERAAQDGKDLGRVEILPSQVAQKMGNNITWTKHTKETAVLLLRRRRFNVGLEGVMLKGIVEIDAIVFNPPYPDFIWE